MNILQQGMYSIVLAAEKSPDTTSLYTKAVLNTILGMGTVFIVLIFISYIISLLKYIPKIIDKFNKNIDNPQSVSMQSYNQTDLKEQTADIEEINNEELVAVITAAIMASMGNEAPFDGLVVRSIRRLNSKRR